MRGVPLPFPSAPLLFLLLLFLLLRPVGAAQTFPRDLEPRSIVGLAATATYPRFGGLRGDQPSARLGLDIQQLLLLNRTLLVAARDHIYLFELGQDQRMLYPERHLKWEPRDRENCAMRGRRQDECHNYIRVLVSRDPETLLACGTNAFSPLCRTYRVGSLAPQGDELSGQARCPFDAKQSVVALFVDGSLYSATVADFQASDAVIYRSLSPGRTPLRTLKYSSRWLQEPHFVQALPYGPFIYFFFREVAVELSTLGKVVVARVARVCRNDRGGSPRVLERRWTSFLKLRLQCSVPGDATFYFDVLEAVTPPQSLHGRPALLALFGTQPNSIPGSAVCAFYLADVERAFEGPFAEPRGATWIPVPEDRVPQPRPGCCAGLGAAAGVITSGDFPDETLAFAKEHPLLHGALAPAGGRPLFTRTGTRLTQLAVDTGAGPRQNQTVIFLGTEDGRVLKVLAPMGHPEATQQPGGTPAPSDSQEPQDTGATGATGATWDISAETVLLEEISLYDPERCRGPQGASRVLGLQLHPPGQELFVAFAGCLVRLPLSRCPRYGACRRSCLAAQDPYCVWSPTRGCVPFSEDLLGGFEQNPEGSSDSAVTCQDAATVGDGDRDLAHGVRQPGPGAALTVPLPVLLGCVLGAFTLGALAAGLVATCYRRPAAPKEPLEPPTTPRSPAQQPPAPRLYPLLPPQPGAEGGLRDPPELPSPEPTPQSPQERLMEPRWLQCTHLGGISGCPEPPGPGPPPKVTLQRLHSSGLSGGSGWPVTPQPASSFTNRVQPGTPFPPIPPVPHDGTPHRFDVPPDSPPPPRRPLAQRHSVGGFQGRPPGLPRGLTRMHSLGTPGGQPWCPRHPILERSQSLKPPVLPKPPLVLEGAGRP